MSISASRKNLVSDLLAMFEEHAQTPEEARQILTAKVYLRGDVDEVYQEFIEQIESKHGHERGLGTRSDQVVAKYLVGKHYRHCVLEVDEKPLMTTDRRYCTFNANGLTHLVMEN